MKSSKNAVVMTVVFWLLFFVDQVHAHNGKLSGRRSSNSNRDLQKMSLARGQRHSTNNSGGGDSDGLRSIIITTTRSRSLKGVEDEDCGTAVTVGVGGALKKKKSCNVPTVVTVTSPTTRRPTPSPTVSPISVVETALPTTATRTPGTDDFATPTMTPMTTTTTTTTSPSDPGFAWSPPTLQPGLTPTDQQSPTTTTTTTTTPVQAPPVTQPSTTRPSSTPTAIPETTTTSPTPSLSPSLIIVSRQPTLPTAVPPTSNNNNDTILIDKTTITNEETGIVDTRMTCREPMPNDAFGTTDQLITYAYILNVMPGTVVSFILPEIENVIQNEMSKDFLNCSFVTSAAGPSFFVHQLSTAPADQPMAGCFDEERLFDAECYRITGYMRAVIFYLPTTTSATTAITNLNNSDPLLGQHSPEHRRYRQRFLASQIEDPNVLETFEAWFEEFFASDDMLMHVNNSLVASVNFAGITNEYQPPPPPESQEQTLVVVGAVLAGCVGVIVAALLVNYGIKKQQQRAQARFYREAMDYVDEELDKGDDNGDHNNNKDNGRSTTRTKNMIRNVVVVGEDETVHTGFPVLVDDGLRDPEDIRREPNNYSLVKNSTVRSYVNHLDGVHFVPSVDPASMLEATRKDLGPRQNDQVNSSSPRRYKTTNTVEL